MKITKYIDGGTTRCVQASFRMLVHAKTGKDIGSELADEVTGYVEGRGTWQFRMFLGLASYGMTVLDHEKFDIHLFLRDPEAAIKLQVGDPQVVAAIVDETDFEAETLAVKKCIDSSQIEFIETSPNIEHITEYLADNRLLMVNVNRRILDNKDGREGHILIVEKIVNEQVVVHDPGPGGGLNIPIDIELFRSAWTSPAPEMANIIAVKA